MSWFIKVADTNDVLPGTGKVVRVEGRNITLFNVAGSFYAIDNNCSHDGGPLVEGELCGEIITCPWHNAKFNVKTGEATGPPASESVQAFPVRVQGADVLVEVD